MQAAMQSSECKICECNLAVNVKRRLFQTDADLKKVIRKCKLKSISDMPFGIVKFKGH